MRPRTESLTVTFVRHAESTNNIIERDTKLPARERLRHFLLAREADPALSKLGAAQADALHRHPALRALFGNTRAGKVELLLVASPMQRAWRTAAWRLKATTSRHFWRSCVLYAAGLLSRTSR